MKRTYTKKSSLYLKGFYKYNYNTLGKDWYFEYHTTPIVGQNNSPKIIITGGEVSKSPHNSLKLSETFGRCCHPGPDQPHCQHIANLDLLGHMYELDLSYDFFVINLQKKLNANWTNLRNHLLEQISIWSSLVWWFAQKFGIKNIPYKIYKYKQCTLSINIAS